MNAPIALCKCMHHVIYFFGKMNNTNGISDALKRSEHGVHVARSVIIHQGENNGVHKCNHVLGTVGGNAQQHIGAQHIEQKHEVEKTGKVDHCGVIT